jgi:hypothetical protein
LTGRLWGPILILNMFTYVRSAKITPKAEETGLRILDSALDLFRQEGFDTTTMWTKSLATLTKVSALPLMRPVRKSALQLMDVF